MSRKFRLHLGYSVTKFISLPHPETQDEIESTLFIVKPIAVKFNKYFGESEN